MPEPELIDRFEGVTDTRGILVARWAARAWLNLLLFAATLLTTTAFGFGLVSSFANNRSLDLTWVFTGYSRMFHADESVWTGLQFSLPLLLVLLAHELGHYLECLRRGIRASLPYFLPSPTLFGTLGAFIRIRSPIYTREGLFDIGISGPLAGFAVLLPFLVTGVWMSKVIPGSMPHDALVFGTPLAVRLIELCRFPGVAAAHISLHPMAMAAWAGLLATAINLLPMGQLDGGHILYALSGERGHRAVTLAFIAVLGVMGVFYWAWWIWAVVMFIFGRRHPLVYDREPLSRGRLALSGLAACIFILSISVVPVRAV